MKTWKIQHHGLERPWSSSYWAEHPPFQYKDTAIVEPILERDWMWFRGDRVEILTGPDKGKQVCGIFENVSLNESTILRSQFNN